MNIIEEHRRSPDRTARRKEPMPVRHPNPEAGMLKGRLFVEALP